MCRQGFYFSSPIRVCDLRSGLQVLGGDAKTSLLWLGFANLGWESVLQIDSLTLEMTPTAKERPTQNQCRENQFFSAEFKHYPLSGS